MSAGIETVSYEVHHGVAAVTLNRPEALNAWNEALGRDLQAALSRAADDDSVRAVLLTGAGRGFCSGADLRGGFPLTPAGKPDLLSRLRDNYNPTILAVRELDKPVVAAIAGGAVGVGASLALACDLIVAARSAYFLLAFANLGLSVDGGASVLLAGRVGFTRAAEMALLADRVGAEQALAWGLVNEVVEDAELPTVARNAAARLGAGPPGAYAAIKALFNTSCFAGLEEALEREALLQQERGESADFAEGVSAFLAKRAARFTGA
ncbi:MAG TPA: enoyl-CoA hydratase-related protein [Solirubrobacteraceae bacterium]|nr:enoyl-CoA hydratase-related protein [Solirubrobacteraceae bacterium]